MIRLVGPGGAGKSTVGALLAQRLDVPFVDLDEEFVANVGDISLYLSSHRYDAYAKRNVEVYFSLVSVVAREAVLALSSGFMAYRRDVHPDYESCRRDIASSPSTFVLLPSLDFEACVAETCADSSSDRLLVRQIVKNRSSALATTCTSVFPRRRWKQCDRPARSLMNLWLNKALQLPKPRQRVTLT